jgi:phosphatidate cytidylyltransferase
MSDADPARPSAPPLGAPKLRAGELALRVVSALLLAPIAVGIAYVGDWPFAAFWG